MRNEESLWILSIWRTIEIRGTVSNIIIITLGIIITSGILIDDFEKILRAYLKIWTIDFSHSCFLVLLFKINFVIKIRYFFKLKKKLGQKICLPRKRCQNLVKLNFFCLIIIWKNLQYHLDFIHALNNNKQVFFIWALKDRKQAFFCFWLWENLKVVK